MNAIEKKIMIRVNLPLNGKAYDVLIPDALRLEDVVPTLSEMLRHLLGDELILSDSPRLYREESGMPVSGTGRTLTLLGINDADAFYFV